MHRKASCLALLAILALSGFPLSAAKTEIGPRVSLVTIMPGQPLYSAFGHTAVRVRDGEWDRLYNFGIAADSFDFGFALRLLRGRMNFMGAALDTDESFAFYRDEEHRGILEQDLNLPPDQAKALVATLDSATKVNGGLYNYRFFSDNCATKPAQLIRAAIGDASPAYARLGGKTLRGSLASVLDRRPWLDFGIGVLLGSRADRKLDAEPIFLPADLEAWAFKTNTGVLGRESPLVSAARTIYAGRNLPKPTVFGSPLFLSVIAAILALAITSLAVVGRGTGIKTVSAIFDWLLAIAVFAVWLGILVLWLSAGYEEVGWNLNLCWASPLFGLALALRRQAGGRVSLWLFAISATCAALAAMGGGFGLQVLPLGWHFIAAALALRAGAGFYQIRARSRSLAESGGTPAVEEAMLPRQD